MVFLSLGSFDFIPFLNRLVDFFEDNFNKGELAAKRRLDHMFQRIIPSCKELKKFMSKKHKNKHNIIMITVLKLMQKYL